MAGETTEEGCTSKRLKLTIGASRRICSRRRRKNRKDFGRNTPALVDNSSPLSTRSAACSTVPGERSVQQGAQPRMQGAMRPQSH